MDAKDLEKAAKQLGGGLSPGKLPGLGLPPGLSGFGKRK
jgi:signal recognition particle subunit SRP54